MAEKSICPICGEPTFMVYGKYPRKDGLCGPCSKRFMQKEIEQCPDCGKWHNTEESCTCKAAAPVAETKRFGSDTPLPQKHFWESTAPEKTESEPTETACIVCGKPSYGKSVCKTCYAEVIASQEDLDKNKKKWELKDYYYNLKAFIGRLKNYEDITTNIYKLFAIAWLLKTLYKDEQLTDVVDDDVKHLIKVREKLKGFKFDEQHEQHGKTIIAVADIERNRATDGHICKSEGEVIIDDILYKGHVCHAYERRVKEIPPTKERSVIADWFVPLDGFDGIYIEFWGMDTKDYQDNKEEKLKLYEKYSSEVKLIQIHKHDISDRQTLEDRLFQELKAFGWKR